MGRDARDVPRGDGLDAGNPHPPRPAPAQREAEISRREILPAPRLRRQTAQGRLSNRRREENSRPRQRVFRTVPHFSMFKYLLKGLELARPYRFRLIVGIICGFLAGVANPLLMVSVRLAI